MDKLIDKDDRPEAVLSEEEQEKVKESFGEWVDRDKFELATVSLSPEDAFVTITRSEFERRMSEMQAMNGMAMFGSLPEKYELSINANHSLCQKLLKAKSKGKQRIVENAVDLAKLSQGLLKGEELARFVERQMESL